MFLHSALGTCFNAFLGVDRPKCVMWAAAAAAAAASSSSLQLQLLCVSASCSGTGPCERAKKRAVTFAATDMRVSCGSTREESSAPPRTNGPPQPAAR